VLMWVLEFGVFLVRFERGISSEAKSSQRVCSLSRQFMT
jgi:hypothetical protein